MAADKQYIRSYLALRRAVGLIGIFLPIVLLTISSVLGKEVAYSVSRYYHVHWFTRNIYVSAISILGIFMLFYIGYDKWDNITKR